MKMTNAPKIDQSVVTCCKEVNKVITCMKSSLAICLLTSRRIHVSDSFAICKHCITRDWSEGMAMFAANRGTAHRDPRY